MVFQIFLYPGKISCLQFALSLHWNVNHLYEHKTLIMENPFEENQMKRPTLLTVICILTFIGSGWGILYNLFSLFRAGMMDANFHMEQYSTMMGELENQGAPAFFHNLLNSSMEMIQAGFVHAREMAIINLILGVISILGAILMFQLKRLGFYLYTAAQILLLFVPSYFVGFSIVVVLQMFFLGVISFVFIILYGLNLKYMR